MFTFVKIIILSSLISHNCHLFTFCFYSQCDSVWGGVGGGLLMSFGCGVMLCPLFQGPLRLSDLEMRYLRHFGIPLRVRDFGFNSTRELLAAATDLFFIQQGQLGSMVNLREHMLPRPVLRPFNTHSRTGPIKPESLRTNKTACKGPDNRVLTPTESSGY